MARRAIKRNLNVVGIIPARMASSRFPGKPLAKIKGKAMIYYVYSRSKVSNVLNDIYIATCDSEIFGYCMENSIQAVMTKDIHERASDRAAEAMLLIEEKTKKKIDIAVMIQGDEPMVYPEMIDEVANSLLKDDKVDVANLMYPLKEEEASNANIVKIVMDKNNFALYFSREPIPSMKKGIKEIRMYKQIAVIPFRRDFLIKFNGLSSTPLEIAESCDMLRLLEHGYKIKMVLSPFNTYSVDTAEDLERVKNIMEAEKWQAEKR